MNFQETLQYLETLQESRMRLDLGPSFQLLEILEHPDRKLKSVIVGGTNGKGSVCAYLTSIAKSAGIRVGTYTSPHLEDVTERVAIDGKPVPDELFSQAATELRNRIEDSKFSGVTYFEFLTMLALILFGRKECELCIFEVGLGGRLDTTNTLERLGVVITTIGFDHMAILGNSLEEIASEKAALMKPGKFAILSKQPEAAQKVLTQLAQKLEVHPMMYERDFKVHEGTIGLKGKHQKINAASAAFTARHLGNFGFDISDMDIDQGILSASLPGRLERFTRNGTEIWLDVAHNRDSVDALTSFFSESGIRNLTTVVGLLKDKEADFILPKLESISASLLFCKPNSPRAWQRSEQSPTEALHQTLQSSKGPILCTGSFYVVGEIRTELQMLGFKSS